MDEGALSNRESMRDADQGVPDSVEAALATVLIGGRVSVGRLEIPSVVGPRVAARGIDAVTRDPRRRDADELVGEASSTCCHASDDSPMPRGPTLVWRTSHRAMPNVPFFSGGGRRRADRLRAVEALRSDPNERERSPAGLSAEGAS